MKDYTVIDLEMTGLDPKTETILEVGAIRVREHTVADTLQFFVQPGRKIPEKITKLTGITQQMADGGITRQEALQRVVSFVGEDVLVGHNLIFDYSFLKQLAVNERVPFEKKAVDTLKLARKLLTEPEKKSLDSLCAYYHLGNENRHRALDDCEATMELFELLQREYATVHEADFVPKPLQYRPKRQTPATPAQLRRFRELVEYHRLEKEDLCRLLKRNMDDWEECSLTRSECSRLTDRILTHYGRIHRV